MKYYLIGLVFSFLVIAYGIYTAPMMDETTGRIIKPGKRLRDLFKRNRKSSDSAGSYSDLEKLGRGRSKY